MPGKHSIEFMHNEWTTLSISLSLSLSHSLFDVFHGAPIRFYYLFCFFFFRLGLSYVQCIKTIAQAEEPQSVFICEAQLEETEKELKPQQGFNYGLYCRLCGWGRTRGLTWTFWLCQRAAMLCYYLIAAAPPPQAKKKQIKRTQFQQYFMRAINENVL